MKKLLLFFSLIFATFCGYSQNEAPSFWEDALPDNTVSLTEERWITPKKFRSLRLDKIGFEKVLLRFSNAKLASNNRG